MPDCLVAKTDKPNEVIINSTAEAVAETIKLAREADRLGYHRYWLAEHHSLMALADPCPEILVARVAAETTRIRVGTGGVMLPHYSPLKVAEQFRMLEALYPQRIDLGIGRGLLAADALQQERLVQLTDVAIPAHYNLYAVWQRGHGERAQAVVNAVQQLARDTLGG